MERKITVLNFSHPLTLEQAKQLEKLTGAKVEERNFQVLFDNEAPYEPQVDRLIKQVGEVSGDTMVILPAFSSIAVLIMRRLEDKVGWHLPIVRIKRTKKGRFDVYQVAEVLN
jgi:hypothetical protein